MTHSTSFSAFCLAGTHSGCGKTTVTLGILAALKARGLKVQPCKCGPDYLDPGHHEAACGTPSCNLDTWMMGADAVRESFARRTAGAEVAVIEGVMGLFDGARPDSLSGSTAEIARLLGVPVILVIDAGSMAGSAAALVKGFAEFAKGVEIVGVIANRVGSEHHQGIIARTLAAHALPPLLGALPKNGVPQLAERHLGLVSAEPAGDPERYRELGRAIARHLDLERLLALGRRPRPQPASQSEPARPRPAPAKSRPRLGLARDRAFQFYYRDNLELLAAAGIEIIPFSPLEDTRLPTGLDGLYLGGGYPELYAEQLGRNRAMREAIRELAAGGGAIYAECGGLMYLGRELIDPEGRQWPMCGLLPFVSKMGKRRFRLGYVEAESRVATIFGPAGTRWRGHRFHWSQPDPEPAPATAPLVCRRPDGEEAGAAGYRRGRILGTYIHAHFAGRREIADHWAAFLRTPQSDQSRQTHCRQGR